MRTTLKRGIGRGAAFDGNGRPVLPPEVLSSAVTRYRQPPPPRHGALYHVARVAVWLLVLAVVVAGGLAAGAYLYFERELVEGVQARSADVKKAAQQLDIAPADRTAIALVIGYDKRLGPEAEVTGRSDTVMLIRADPGSKTLSMLSFPRDLRAEIRCPGRTPFLDRINRAYSECKAPGTLASVRALTGLPIHYLITVNYRGFKQVVAKVGGVWVDVDRRYFNDNSQGGERFATIDLEPGYQKLNGSDSLDFVRYRHTDSDLYRISRQQLFVKAFNEQLRTAFSASFVPDLVKVLRDNVEVASAGSGGLSTGTLIAYGLFAFDLPQGSFFQARIENLMDGMDPIAGYYAYAPPEEIQKAVTAFANPDVEAPEKATRAALGLRPRTEPGPPPSRTSVVVLNGNGLAGAAAMASTQLAERKYVVLEPPPGVDANAPRQDFPQTQIFFNDRHPRAEAAARRLAKLFVPARVAPTPREYAHYSNGAMLLAVVGRPFTGTLTAAEDDVPQRQPAEVRHDPAAARDTLRSVRGRVPFRLMLPTRIEESSSLDYAGRPVRVYDLAGHKAVRLTFLSGKEVSAYWGIQMTDWEDAPVLREPNRTITMDGRKFDLHYVGPKLRMVVLRQDGVTYWVVNTIRNTLNNETMLAIARGLQPLR